MTPKSKSKQNMKHYLFAIAVILHVQPHAASSQCTDSLTVAQSNHYLLIGAQAREQLAICREYRKLDSAHITKLQNENKDLVKRINDDAYKMHNLTRICVGLSVLVVIFGIL
jgi:pyruvate/2-oxoglutarate dehydrogenase complex dihydrolipoamide acyltransferase (E2) component